MPFINGVWSGLSQGISDIADEVSEQSATAAGMRQRSAVLQALEEAYRNATGDATMSQTALAKQAGTYADTPEFQRGLADEAALQGQGTQAALLGRINAMRAAEGFPAFDPASAEAQSTAPANYWFNQQMGPASLAAQSDVRAQILRELEAAYSGLGSNVATSFRDSAGGTYDPNNPDYLRSMQSDVYAGTTGAQRALQAKIDALRAQQGLEPFSDASTSSQRYQAAGQAVQGAVPQTQTSTAPATMDTSDEASAPTTEAGDSSERVEEENKQTNAVTALASAKKKPAQRVV